MTTKNNLTNHKIGLWVQQRRREAIHGVKQEKEREKKRREINVNRVESKEWKPEKIDKTKSEKKPKVKVKQKCIVFVRKTGKYTNNKLSNSSNFNR